MHRFRLLYDMLGRWRLPMPYCDPEAKKQYMKAYRAAHRQPKKPRLKLVSFKLVDPQGAEIEAGRIVPGQPADLCPTVEFGDTAYRLVGIGKDRTLVFQSCEPAASTPTSAPHGSPVAAPEAIDASDLPLAAPVVDAPSLHNDSPIASLAGSPSILGSRYQDEPLEPAFDRTPNPEERESRPLRRRRRRKVSIH
jgi:hypothetical protein